MTEFTQAAQPPLPYEGRDVFFHLFFLSAIAPLHNVGLTVEHMPYGILCMAFAHRVRLDVVAFTFGLTALFIATMIWHNTFNSRAVSYLIATINILSFLWFVPGNEARLIRAARNVFWVSLSVGAMQFLGLMAPLEGLMQIFIQRFHGDRVGQELGELGRYRGVTMLETEPSRASGKIILLYIIAFHLDRKPLSRALGLALAAQIFLIKSTTGIFLSLVAIGAFALRYPRMQVAIGMVLIVGGPIVVSILQSNPKVALIWSLYEARGFEGLYTGLVATSGGRVLAIVNTVQSILANPMGHGADPAFFNDVRSEQLQRLVEHYKTRANTRPTAMFLYFLYTYGWIPFAILLAFTYRMSRQGGIAPLTSPIFWVLMFCGIFYSAPGSPMLLVAWVLYVHRNASTAVENTTEAPSPAPPARAGFQLPRA